MAAQIERQPLPCIESFAKDVKELDPPGFRARHGGAFLLMHGSDAQLSRPGQLPQWTVVSDDVQGYHGARDLAKNYVVIALKQRRPSRLGHIAVGRAETCDLVVPDTSVSLYHAFFREEQDGGFVLQDAGSKNGTWVNDQRVPAQGKGPPARVESGSEVRIGNMEFLFLGCNEFRELISKLVN
ncbi:MAG TPA: FHA domain-containing protein [Myxococcota bacterium]|nr:FHA domain-containing protein [Myxococcota bacterium]HRY92178.1 FHA domain-containing protein [Myxococcota bacterium]HSA22365.1 FHA domain-containing protein [Myxococcota bacterium]